MSDPIVRLQTFCARIIEEKELPSPVRIEVTDVGANAVFEMDAIRGDEGLCSFSEVRPADGTVWRPAPYSVRFTAKGKPSIVMEYLGQ
jgi:hypothetical protein